MLALPALATAVPVGKVVSIAEGDTLRVLVKAQQIKVRLAEIDCPEVHQPSGAQAKKALGSLAFGRLARVVAVDRDRYGGGVGRALCGRSGRERGAGATGPCMGLPPVGEGQGVVPAGSAGA